MTDILEIQHAHHREAGRAIRRAHTSLIGTGITDRKADRVIEAVLQAVHDGLGDAMVMDDAQHRVRLIAAAAGWPMEVDDG